MAEVVVVLFMLALYGSYGAAIFAIVYFAVRLALRHHDRKSN